MPQTYTLPLTDPQATIEAVDGKGASLARLSEAGLPVPDGFYVTTMAYHRFVTINKLQEQILAMVSAVKPDQPAILEEAFSHIKKNFCRI